MYFDPDGNGIWPDRPSIGWQDWSPPVRAECLAARDAAVFVDQSMYGKILVQGRDAVRALNRVSGAAINVPVNTSVYTQFLNARGGIEADVTITRLAAEQFMVVTGHPSQLRDQAHIRAHADADWRFEIFDATSAYGLLTIHGPKCRAILQALSGDDLSTEVFPFGAAREIDIAHARVWAIRRSFLGELGFELMMPTEFVAHVYDALVEEGAPQGLRHAGMFALGACRLEKGFRHFGHDIGEDDTPFEAGLGFAVNLDKGAFVGREVLAEQKSAQGAATKHRMAAVQVMGATAEDGPYLIHNEPIWREQSCVGHVTSGGWGWRLDAMVGLASLHNGDGVTKQWIEEGDFEVEIAGERCPALVQFRPFYDPDGSIMRG